jgi:peptidoglycan/LPS O-acetylase OafA/YrhL
VTEPTTATGKHADTTRDRFAGIEGLRGIAALTVVAHHVALHLGSGDLGPVGRVTTLMSHGLTLFFALSGFLLYKPFADAIAGRRGFPSVRRYAQNRFLRIYPAYATIFVLVAFVFGSAYVQGSPSGVESGDVVGRMSDPIDILTGLTLTQTYVPQSVLTGIGPAWSLTTEVAFYILLPLLAIAAFKAAARFGRYAVLAPPAVLIFVGLTTRAWVHTQKAGMTPDKADSFSWGHTWTAVVERSVLGQADLFGYGMLAAVAIALYGSKAGRGPLRAVWVAAVVALLVAVKFPVEVYESSAFGVTAALVILGVSLHRRCVDNPVAKVLELAPFVFLGQISYSLYLWHTPVIWWFKDRDWVAGGGLDGLAVDLLLIVAVTVPLSWLTYNFVEKPALRLKRR